jgi:hypothetical protein
MEGAGAIAAHHHDDLPTASITPKPDLLTIGVWLAISPTPLDFGVITARDTWSAEKVVSRLPEAAKLRFPKDIQALKSSVKDRILALG